MAMLQLKCPDTGRPVDLRDAPPDANIALSASSRRSRVFTAAGKNRWTSGHLGLAIQALYASPDVTRVLIDGEYASART